MRKFSPAMRVALFASAVAASPALAADTYTQTVFFGDSLTDAGYFRPLLPPSAQPVTGQFTTNPGDVWAELLADYYNTNGDPNGNGQTGDNYAAGGARVGIDYSGALGPIPSLETQVENYLDSTGGTADPDALYTVWGGANDLFAITSGGENPAVTIPAAVADQVGIVQALTDAGAQYILVPTVPDLGITPAFVAQGPTAQAAGTAVATNFNTALFASLQAAGLQVIPLDTFNLLREIVADPTTYGFTNATGTACQPQITANSLLCNPTSLVSPSAPDDYVFADGVHPTTGAHRVLFQYAVSVLESPRLIQELPHNAFVVGRSRAERVAQHSWGAAPADGIRWWGNARFDKQSTAQIESEGPGVLVGLDIASGGLVAGAFGGYGRTKGEFGTNFGEMKQTDLTGGLYAGFHGDGVWANAQVSYSSLSYDVDRAVTLGDAVRIHSGSPDGSNFTIGGQAGFDFTPGRWRSGPVLGLLSQRIKVDGYHESDGDLSTALTFHDQRYRSLLGTFGWRAAYELAPGTSPYAQVTYDREFKRLRKEATAELQTVPGMPYAVPGAKFDRSYATATVGVRSAVSGIDANLGGSMTFGREDGEDISAFLTLGGRF